MPDSSRPELVDPQPGLVIEVPEWGYCFGSGTLTLEVQWVSPPYQRGGWRWRQVKGRTVHWDGRRLDRPPVEVRLDAVRLPRQRPST